MKRGSRFENRSRKNAQEKQGPPQGIITRRIGPHTGIKTWKYCLLIIESKKNTKKKKKAKIQSPGRKRVNDVKTSIRRRKEEEEKKKEEKNDWWRGKGVENDGPGFWLKNRSIYRDQT